jgi:tRNA (guanine37-N1)-methyltransferase
VRRWRLRESLRRTLERRPDLLEGRQLSAEEGALIEEIAEEPAADDMGAGFAEAPADRGGRP